MARADPAGVKIISPAREDLEIDSFPPCAIHGTVRRAEPRLSKYATAAPNLHRSGAQGYYPYFIVEVHREQLS